MMGESIYICKYLKKKKDYLYIFLIKNFLWGFGWMGMDGKGMEMIRITWKFWDNVGI